MRHILVGIGGLTAKIKEIIQKIREPIDKAVEKVGGFIADKAKALIARIRGTDQPREEPPQNEAEHDAQVEAGLAALDKEQQKEDEDHNNALTEDEAIAAAQRVKSAFPVFKSITPVQKGESWEFKYVASKGVHKGLKVEYGEHYTKQDGKMALKLNVVYTTPEGYTYSTDDKRRISSVEGQLQLNEGERNPYAQKVVGREERKSTDDEGHLIATIFSGSGNLDN